MNSNTDLRYELFEPIPRNDVYNIEMYDMWGVLFNAGEVNEIKCAIHNE